MNTLDPSPVRLSDDQLTALRPLACQFPTLDAVAAEIARLSAELTLPKGAVHVISDIHGEDRKLRHVINNASGTLRPAGRTALRRQPARPPRCRSCSTLIFYPRETLERLDAGADRPRRRSAVLPAHAAPPVRGGPHPGPALHPAARGRASFPTEYRDLFWELLHEPAGEHGPAYHDALIDALVRHDRALEVIRLTVRVVRNLAIDELVIAGDCWDRGPRGDRVVDYLHAAAERLASSGATTTPPGSAPAWATRP